MKRQVFQKMFEEYPSLRHIDRTELSISGTVYTDNYYYLFEAGPDPNTGRYLSEDYMFLKRWRDMGGKVYADLNVTLAHHGNHPFLGRAGLAYAYSEKNGIVGARPEEKGKYQYRLANNKKKNGTSLHASSSSSPPPRDDL